MKQHLKLPYAAFALALSILSCSKKSETPPPPEIKETFATIIDHVYQLDTTKSAPLDTMSKTYFRYDGLNRLVFDSTITYFNSNKNSSFTTTEIHYSGTDSMASWSAYRSWQDSGQPCIDTVTYTFNAGKYVKDTTYYDDRLNAEKVTARTFYSYNNDIVTRDFQNWIPAENYSSSARDTAHLTIVAGDITHLAFTSHIFTNGLPSGTSSFQTDIVYLPNPNPYYQSLKSISLPYPFSIGGGWASNLNYTPRKLISTQVSNYGNISYSYKFRSDGYPVSSIVTRGSTEPVPIIKLLFYYK